MQRLTAASHRVTHCAVGCANASQPRGIPGVGEGEWRVCWCIGAGRARLAHTHIDPRPTGTACLTGCCHGATTVSRAGSQAVCRGWGNSREGCQLLLSRRKEETCHRTSKQLPLSGTCLCCHPVFAWQVDTSLRLHDCRWQLANLRL
jgi:hypothetical protein